MELKEEIVNKILQEEKTKNELYPESSVLDKLNKEFGNKAEEVIAGRVLGRILDKIELANKFIEIIPLFYDEAGMFWMFDLKYRYWRMVDEIDILNIVYKACDVNIIASKDRTEILNALKQVARSKRPKELDKNFLQFDKEIINFSTGDRFPATSKYFVTNPIPHKIGKSDYTPNIDSLFNSWVKPEDVNKLYEIIAYSMLSDYPIERIFCLHGAGSNGKSVFRQILRKTIGDMNCVSTSFETLLKSRFEIAKLYKKLVCEMGETNLNKLENTQLIKRLTSGKDLVGMEFKNKKPFDAVSYAKLIISTNNLPPTDDKTDGFYRRWLIIDFPNTFEIEKDVISNIPEEEFENICYKCINILYELLKKRIFSNEGSFKQRRERYEERSNPFDKFWSEFVDDSDANTDIPCWEFNKELNQWLKENKFREMSDKTIMSNMRDKHINQVPIFKEWYENGEQRNKTMRCWGGIKWKR